MSGGSLGYFYNDLESHIGDFGDKELDELVKDLAKLFHDREWYLSSDTGEGAWNESRDRFKEKWFTAYGRQERIEKYGSPNTGKIIVHNNHLGINKYILPSELEKYEQEGWEKGQSTKNRKKFSEETIRKLKISHLGQKSNTKGKIKINNGTVAKYIKKSELDYYMSIGWKKGALPFTEEHRSNLSKGNKNNPNIFNFKGYKYINNGVEEKRVHPSELEHYFSCGWRLGRINNYFPNHKK